MNARQAKRIRIGINARCVPYVTGGDDSDGYYTVLDFTRLRKHFTDWERIGKYNPLSRRAYERTRRWTSQREEVAANV